MMLKSSLLKTNFYIMLSIACFWSGDVHSVSTYSSNAKIGMDGSGNIVAVWEAFNLNARAYCINGTFGSSFPNTITQISDPSLYNALSPILVPSRSSKATTKAVAVWLANDLSTTNKVIQASICTVLSWNTIPSNLSLNDGSEVPNNDFQATISDDGNTIVITWSSYFPNIQNTVGRFVQSTNGGLTWSSPGNFSGT